MLSIWCNTPIKTFFHCQNSSWTCWFWWLLVLLPFFVLPLPHRQNVSLWGLFSSGETKKKSLGLLSPRLSDYGGWGTGVMPVLVKNCWTLTTVWAAALVYHPSWNGQMSSKKNSLKESSRKIHWSQTHTACQTNASCYTGTDGLLEHSPSRESLCYKGPTLQKIIPVYEATCFQTLDNRQHKTNLWENESSQGEPHSFPLSGCSFFTLAQWTGVETVLKYIDIPAQSE